MEKKNTKKTTTSNLSQQIKTKKRVRDHGEVFTPDFIVQDMLDLVKGETERIDSRFLEPACGDGNFLAPILERKLNIAKKRYSRLQIDYERNALIALASIYGIELLKDNVQKCRKRLFNIFLTYYKDKYKKKIKESYLKSAKYILKRNILWGDALTLQTPDKNSKPIIFSSWSRLGSYIIRDDYYFSDLIPMDKEGLFDNRHVTSDLGDSVFDPKKIDINFPKKHYLKLDYKDAE
ncbi:SAM-dependent DNA methyltransferase [Patescibacteria group bacterium]|nr:SAM-dependent DNA methyltransferase [Patescibacteria group bacterium]